MTMFIRPRLDTNIWVVRAMFCVSIVVYGRSMVIEWTALIQLGNINLPGSAGTTKSIVWGLKLFLNNNIHKNRMDNENLCPDTDMAVNVCEA